MIQLWLILWCTSLKIYHLIKLVLNYIVKIYLIDYDLIVMMISGNEIFVVSVYTFNINFVSRRG